ncbi:outer membrane protein [Aequorivita sublithincola DSM 14238]|uniref:Outer membrane protein n=1 Tax=Aequorivita sublithincola (strain DSM 14238 / LMG 21431 / ACAM 643 / 9-3) TaxID=746697 RepID=I3YS53_AEQSU|nr:OmpH family outer membrane protein [Aequorivita sublithincola]AFL79821.1 outer membrane protein [Aequorivita sublithincola DSM 14238]
MKFLKIAIFFIGLSTFAQGKVGAVDIDYILSNMPELTSVQKELDTYGKQLDTDLNKKVTEYKRLAEEYKTGEATFTAEQKKAKQTALLTLENDIQKFQQNGSQLMEIKKQEALKPLYQKIGVALETVAKAQNYTQVMQTSQDMVYLDPNYDLTVPIIQELGITITPEMEGK